jgi:hypothetical protein
VSKIAAAVFAFVGMTLFSIPMSAQLIPTGNVYAGISYGQLTDVINVQSYRGWNGSVEAMPFPVHPHLGFVLDASGFYRSGVTQYNLLLGPRLSTTYGRWRPFAQAMGGIQRVNSNGSTFNPIAWDIGGGVDYKLGFKNFSWRLQGDYLHTHHLSADQNDYRISTGIVWRF